MRKDFFFLKRRNELHAQAVREATIKVSGRQEDVGNFYVTSGIQWM
jgi:hypothetical protein